MSTNKVIIDCWKFVKFRPIHLLLVVEILVSEEASEVLTVVVIPVARGGSRGSVEPPFRVTGSKYFSHTPHITSGI